MPGDMGHGCAIAFREHGLRVVTSLAGRSARTRGLAETAQLEDLGSLEAVVRQADLILSILPPESAQDQAKAVAAAMIAAACRPPYVACNAISPATTKLVGAKIERAGAPYIDGGIIGANPVKAKGGTRLFVSGPDTAPVEALHGKGVIVRPLGPEIGRASAMKMVNASATKGTFSLHAATLTAAHALGLTEVYLAEIGASNPQMRAAMEAKVPRIPFDAGTLARRDARDRPNLRRRGRDAEVPRRRGRHHGTGRPYPDRRGIPRDGRREPDTGRRCSTCTWPRYRR